MPVVSPVSDDDPKKDRRFVYVISGLFAAFGLAMLAVFSGGSPTGALARFGAGSLLAFAAFTSGSLLGLLFGIPKATKSQSDERDGRELTPSTVGQFLAANNNLVEISDWLTKVLVGATLTQVNKLPSVLVKFGTHYGAAMGGESVAITLLIGFAASGFLSGYLVTRVILQGALHRAGRVAADAAKDGSIELMAGGEEADPIPSPEGEKKREAAPAEDAEEEGKP